tara:strand:+ start:323 stop:523 length:201 start_codon:yes stop_codon:yes gene_type:complete
MPMDIITNINDFFFMIGGYVMLIGWWFTLPTTIAIGAYIMSACVVFGVAASMLIPLYSFIKGKSDE